MKNKTPSAHRVAHAHDHFFRMSMQDKRVAREFFAAHLPSDVLSALDLDQLHLESGTYIDDVRKESIADMLYKTEIRGHSAYLYLVIDHQSRPDVLMPFRMLKYTCNIIDKHIKETRSTQIPLILPLVVYHGEKHWTHSNDIRDLVDAPKEWVNAYFLKPFFLIDLNMIEDAILKERAWVGVMELTLKHIFARDIQPYLSDIIALLKQVEPLDGRSFTETVLTYILDRGELDDKEAFFRLIQTEFSDNVGEKIMTIAEQLRAEGVQKGMMQGIEKGIEQGIEQGIEKGVTQEKIEVAKRLISNHMDLEFIANITDLPLSEIQRMKANL